MVNGIAFCSAAQLLLDGDLAADPRAVGAREAVDSRRPPAWSAARPSPRAHSATLGVSLEHRPQRRKVHVSAFALHKADFGLSYHCFCRLSKSKFGCTIQWNFPNTNHELN